MLVELGLVEQRFAAVKDVLENGASVTDVARRNGVSRQAVHGWLVKYANHGLAGLLDRSSKPNSCPHQMDPVVEARIVEMRREHPGWGPRTLEHRLGRGGISPVPGAGKHGERAGPGWSSSAASASATAPTTSPTTTAHADVGCDDVVLLPCDAGIEQVSLLAARGRLDALPVADAAVDHVVCALSLLHVERLEPVFAEFARVMRPGGTLVTSDMHVVSVYLGGVPVQQDRDGKVGVVPVSRFQASDYVTAALAAGFEVTGCAEPPWPEHMSAGGPGAARWCPDAARAVYRDVPIAVVWRFRLPVSGSR